jgi:hypothetical protein
MAAWTLATAAMLLALLAPALWNGFPLIFPDTGGYLARPFDGTLEMGRSAFYGVFLALGLPLDFWPNVIAQAALTVWMIVLALRVHGLGGRPLLALGVVVFLAIGTALPWYVGQLMPDIFFPIAALAIYLLAFRTQELRSFERAGLAAVIVLTIPTHMALLALCLGLIIVLLLLRRVAPLARLLAIPPPRVMAAGMAVAAGIVLCPLANFAVAGKFAFTPGGESFLFGRLLEDGIVQRYLKEHCPDPTLKLCAYADTLPNDADDWLWANDTLFYKLGGWQGLGEEERRIIGRTLVSYPGEHIATAIRAVFWQLVLFRTDVTTNPWHNAPTVWVFERLTPDLLPRFRAARQQAEPFDLTPINFLHVPVAALAMAGLAAALVLRRRLQISPPAAALCATVLTVFVINAVICGIFSHPGDRYQSRLIPLAPLALVILVLGRRRAELKLSS